MKLKKITITNFRNIPNGTYDLNGSNFLLIGDNQVGKSNFLKACQAVLGDKSAIGINSVKFGEEKARIEAVLAQFNEEGEAIEGTEYTFKAKFKKDSDLPSVEVILPNGFKDEKKSTIGSIIGQIDFDVEEFAGWSRTSEGKKKQINLIKSFLSKEARDAIKRAEEEILVDFNIRTQKSGEIKTYNGFIEEAGMDEMAFAKYREPIDITQLQSQVAEEGAVFSKIQMATRDLKQFTEDIGKAESYIAKLKGELDEAHREMAEISKKAAHAERFLAANPAKMEGQGAQKQLEEAILHNTKHAQRTEFFKKVDKRNSLVTDESALTNKIESNRQMKADIVRDANLPIEGLSFDDDTLFYNGKTVDESMFSFSEIQMLGVEIQMAMARGAQILFIHNGESWGWERLKSLQLKAEERGFQLLMEQVERGTEELKIEIMPKY